VRSLFISDLHLIQDRPAANERFFGFLEDEARGADALYILGDFFEYWIGENDLADPLHAVVAASMPSSSCTATGTSCSARPSARPRAAGSLKIPPSSP
jgi:UDP-2,3-diacylglucosamine hydrolase